MEMHASTQFGLRGFINKLRTTLKQMPVAYKMEMRASTQCCLIEFADKHRKTLRQMPVAYKIETCASTRKTVLCIETCADLRMSVVVCIEHVVRRGNNAASSTGLVIGMPRMPCFYTYLQMRACRAPGVDFRLYWTRIRLVFSCRPPGRTRISISS